MKKIILFILTLCIILSESLENSQKQQLEKEIKEFWVSVDDGLKKFAKRPLKVVLAGKECSGKTSFKNTIDHIDHLQQDTKMIWTPPFLTGQCDKKASVTLNLDCSTFFKGRLKICDTMGFPLSDEYKTYSKNLLLAIDGNYEEDSQMVNGQDYSTWAKSYFTYVSYPADAIITLFSYNDTQSKATVECYNNIEKEVSTRSSSKLLKLFSKNQTELSKIENEEFFKDRHYLPPESRVERQIMKNLLNYKQVFNILNMIIKKGIKGRESNEKSAPHLYK